MPPILISGPAQKMCLPSLIKAELYPISEKVSSSSATPVELPAWVDWKHSWLFMSFLTWIVASYATNFDFGSGSENVFAFTNQGWIVSNFWKRVFILCHPCWAPCLVCLKKILPFHVFLNMNCWVLCHQFWFWVRLRKYRVRRRNRSNSSNPQWQWMPGLKSTICSWKYHMTETLQWD